MNPRTALCLTMLTARLTSQLLCRTSTLVASRVSFLHAMPWVVLAPALLLAPVHIPEEYLASPQIKTSFPHSASALPTTHLSPPLHAPAAPFAVYTRLPPANTTYFDFQDQLAALPAALAQSEYVTALPPVSSW